MDNNMLDKYKKILISERKKLVNRIDSIKENGLEENQRDEISELSIIDNHPADMGTEMLQKETDYALTRNEGYIISQIDKSLENIENGKYGVCEVCGKPIEQERIDFIPYATKCTNCEKTTNYFDPDKYDDRPVEEELLSFPFGRSFKDVDLYDNVEFDGEDSWQSVDEFNTREGIHRNYEDENISGAVVDIENISNQQYKKQLY